MTVTAIDTLKILFITDFTDTADNAFDYAHQLFHECYGVETEYSIAHAFVPVHPYTHEPHLHALKNDQLEKELKKQLEKSAASVRQISGKKVPSYFLPGTLTEVVQKVVDQEEPDLIVIGNEEKTSFQRMTLGSHTMQIADLKCCPVLAVPPAAKFENFEHIVLASDFEPLNIEHSSLMLLKSLAKGSEEKLKVVHVYQDEKEASEAAMKNTAIHRYLSNIPHQHFPIVSDEVFEAIAQFVGEHKPGLLAAIPRDRGFFEGLFHTSVTEKLVYHTQIPILILT